MITFNLETITPETAARLIEEHDEAVANGLIVNRRRKQKAMRRIAADILSDQWFPNTGETAKFEPSGNGTTLHGRHLVDGQNRIAAIALAKRQVQLWIARGVERQAFVYIDSGEKRTLRDVFQIQGEHDATILAPAVQWLSRWDFNQNTMAMSNEAASHAEAKKILEADPSIRKSVQKVNGVTLVGRGLAAALHCIFSKRDPQLADRFVECIATGQNLTAGDPFYVFRERMISNKAARRKMAQPEIIVLAVRAWNAARENRSVKILKSARGEACPVLV